MIQKQVVCHFGQYDPMKVVALLIQKATVHKASVYLTRGERRANAKSLLGLMSLGLGEGAELLVQSEGPDEAEAAAAIVAWLEAPEL